MPMFYPKWVDKLAKMDTEVTKAQRRKEFWYVLELAGVVMNWEPRYYILNLLYIGVVFVVVCYYIPCFIVSMFRVDDLAAIGQYLNYLSLALIALAFIIAAHHKRESMMTIFALNAQGVYKYGDILDSAEVAKLEKLFDVMKKLILVVVPPWLLVVAASVMLSDQVNALFNYDTTVDQDYVNGVYQRMPLKMWFTHTIDTQFKWFIFLASEIMSSGGVAISIGAASLALIFFAQSLIIQMKTLIVAIISTDLRADHLYTTTVGKKPPENPILRRKDRELMGCYKTCLRQTVEHHRFILLYFQMYQDILYLPTGVAVITGAILVAMSAITLLQGGGQPSLMITTCLLILPEVAALFILCEIGEFTKELSEEMFYAMYQFEWSDCSKEVISEMRIMRSMMAEPLILYGILTPLNRDTFGAIMNSAYSYINLVRASEGEET